jgi:hypothetical protein
VGRYRTSNKFYTTYFNISKVEWNKSIVLRPGEPETTCDFICVEDPDDLKRCESLQPGGFLLVATELKPTDDWNFLFTLDGYKPVFISHFAKNGTIHDSISAGEPHKRGEIGVMAAKLKKL